VSDSDENSFSQFINPLKDGGDKLTASVPGSDQSITLADPSNPVKWTRLGKAIAGTFVGLVAVGYQNLVLAFQKLVVEPVNGIRSFVVDLLDALTNPFTSPRGGGSPAEDPFMTPVSGGVVETASSGVEAAWSLSLNEFGIFAYPFAVGIALASVYILARTANRVRKGGVL